MIRLALDLSEELWLALSDEAERDHPGRPDLAATATRLIARALSGHAPPKPTTTPPEPEAWERRALAAIPPPMPGPGAEDTSLVPVAYLPGTDAIGAAQAHLRRRRAEMSYDPPPAPLEESLASLRSGWRIDQ